jgi:hypothetical protein
MPVTVNGGALLFSLILTSHLVDTDIKQTLWLRKLFPVARPAQTAPLWIREGGARQFARRMNDAIAP